MPARPRLLDLFCGAGGAGMGYYRAGFDVTGVDIKPMPRYPFTFHQTDALEFCAEHGHEYDVIHASPPCQRFSVATRFHPGVADTHGDQVTPTRRALMDSGAAYVIENVPGAPLVKPITLCGSMFGLRVYRHRLFESNLLLWAPEHGTHPERPAAVGCPVPEHGYMTVAGHFCNVPAASRAMGIDWMTRDELAQAIPPAYTEYLGRQLIERIEAAA